MTGRVLIVDDDEFMRSSLQLELEEAGFKLFQAGSGEEALAIARKEHVDLVISDVRMPDINGLDLIDALREYQPAAACLVITGYANPDAPVRALKMKVDDYLLKPFTGEELIQSVHAALMRSNRESHRESGTIRTREHFLRIMRGAFLESRYSFLAGHSERVARLSLRIARALAFTPRQMQNLYLAALLHDIGSVELPAGLLGKGRFQDDDRELIKNHPLIAHDLLSPFKELQDTSSIILHHHELWDGSGYPMGLRGEQIPLESRIIGLAEAYDSLTSERPHRYRLSPPDALQKLRGEAGRQFDPSLIALLEKLLRDEDDYYKTEGKAEGTQCTSAVPGQIPPVTDSTSATGPLLQVFFFGPLRIRAGGQDLEDEKWLTRKDKSLFAYLAARQGEIKSEELLMDLFWPQGGEKARHSLHNCISQVRKTLAAYMGDEIKRIIVKKREGYLFSMSPLIHIDAEEFDRHYLKGKSLYEQGHLLESITELQKAGAFYTGEFMACSYDEWSDDLRLRYGQRYLDMQKTMGTYFLNEKKYDMSIECWKKMLSADNCSEDAYFGLMECYRLTCNTNEAIKTYHEYTKNLQKELNLPPPPHVVELYLKLATRA